MARMMHEILAFSRDTGGELKPVTVSLNELMRSALSDLAPVIGDRCIDWRISDLPTVWADRRLLRQAVNQLLGNAIKFTRQCAVPRIDISAKAGGDGVVLCIQDNGDGFDMKYAGKLFRLFYRLHTETEFEGSGRGLATVARIVGRHGGRVWADAMKGQGASFFVFIPAQT
jgi:signal transduction histidine kinase